MSEHSLYNLACSYADQGLKLLWFKLDKTPGIAWSTESSNDRAKLHEWFYHLEPGQRRIGIKTGQDSRGIVVIDIDVNKKNKITGEIADTRSVEEKKDYIRETYGELPETVEVHTPSGGRHLYYIADRPVATLKKIFPGDPIDIDSRGDGGVVVAPDEMHYITDGEFHISNMAPLPEWLYDILARRNPLTRNKTEYTGEIPLIPEMEVAISDALKYLDYSDRDIWIKTGHAVKSLNSDDAKKLWLEWGQQHSTFDPNYTERTWESLHPSEINIATLFYDAKEKGYEPENISSDILIKEQERIATTEKPRFKILTAKDARMPRPDLQWIVKDLIIEGSLGMIVGDAGTGKTYIALDIAISIAEGQPWLGREVLQGPVLIIDEESGEHRLSIRLKKIIEGHHGSDDTPLYFMSYQGMDLKNGLDTFEIEKFIIEKGIKFVVIDSLMEVIQGADENASKDMTPVLYTLNKIKERTQTTFFLIHHTSKSGDNYRGSTAIKGAVDLMLHVDKPEKGETVKIKSLKFRDGEPVSFKADLKFSDYDFRIEPNDEKDTKLKREFKQVHIDILKFISENPDAHTEDLKNNIPGEWTNIKKTIDRMEEFIIKRACGSNTKQGNYYSIHPEKHLEVKMIISKKHRIGANDENDDFDDS
jgi:hypothetical protein